MASVQNILNTASQYLGTNNYNNYCEAFVEQSMLGHTGVYPSAASAWQSQKGVQGTKGMQPGDSVYFAPDKSNNFYGHTGIYAGNGQFISATYNGVKQVDLNQWMQSTGQKLLGYVPSGQEGRGIVKAATVHGGALNNQMALAGNTPDDQQAQLQAQFAQQKAQLAHQQVAEQAAVAQSAQAIPPMTTEKSTQPAYTPSPIATQTPTDNTIQKPAQYPYANYLLPTNQQPTQPQNMQASPQAAPISPITISRPTDYTKPQQNLNPQQPQPGGN